MPLLLVFEDAFLIRERGLLVAPSFPWERFEVGRDLVIELRRDSDVRRVPAKIMPETLRTAQGRQLRWLLVIHERDVGAAGIVDAGTEVWTVDDEA